MTDPLVTVVIPTYRRPEMLRQAIDSALAQTYRDLAVVVFDNASGDATRDVVTSFDDPRVTYVCHERNLGGQRNWRHALSYPKSAYVALLEDDNLFLNHHIENAVRALESAPSSVFYCCAAETFGHDEPRVMKPWWLAETTGVSLLRPHDHFTGWLRGAPFYATSFVMRPASLQFVSDWGGSRWPVCMDILWFAQMAMAGDVVFEHTTGIRYRYHEANWTYSWFSSGLAGIEYRYTFRTIANMALAKGLFTPEKLVADVLQWDVRTASTVVVALSAPEAAPPLRRAAAEIFRQRPDLRSGDASGHTRMAGRIGRWYLRCADRLDRFRASWPPPDDS